MQACGGSRHLLKLVEMSFRRRELQKRSYRGEVWVGVADGLVGSVSSTSRTAYAAVMSSPSHWQRHGHMGVLVAAIVQAYQIHEVGMGVCLCQ